MRKTVLVKVSGDLVTRPDVLEWIRSLSSTRFVVICAGGGAQINEEFKRRGLEIDFGPLGRRTKTFEERQLARDILEQNQARVQDLLAENGIKAVVIIPVLDIGSVLCHVNGDVFVRAAYLGFDDIYIVTLKNRKADKERDFEDLRRVNVVGFSKKEQKSLEKCRFQVDVCSRELDRWYCVWRKIDHQIWLSEGGTPTDENLLRFEYQEPFPLPSESLIRLGLSHMSIEVESISYKPSYRCHLELSYYSDGSEAAKKNAHARVKRFFGRSIEVSDLPVEYTGPVY